MIDAGCGIEKRKKKGITNDHAVLQLQQHESMLVWQKVRDRKVCSR